MNKLFIKIPAVTAEHYHIIDVELIAKITDAGSGILATDQRSTIILTDKSIYYSRLKAEDIYDLICREQSLGKEKLTGEEQIIADAIVVARDVQEFLWDDKSMTLADSWDRDAWLKVFYKRVDKIAEINTGHGSSSVELKKRVLQQASLSIAALKVINNLKQNGSE